jgi:hypothetical protein
MDAAAPFGPKRRPTTKYPIVDTSREEPRKWRKIKRRERRTIEPNDGAYARPQARAVRRRKNERR